MASGNVLATITPGLNHYAGANPATPDYTGHVFVLDYDDTTAELAEFMVYLPPHYAATTGITFTIMWSPETAAGGNVVWTISISSLTIAQDNAATKAFSAANQIIDAASDPNVVEYAAVTFLDGADMDSWGTQEWAKVRIGRDASSGSDTMAGDAQLIAVALKET